MAVRDYIPQDESMTPTELARIRGTMFIRTGANHQDFIPDENHVLQPPSGSEAQAAEALEKALARQAHQAAAEYDLAVQRLKEWSPSMAIQAMNDMPMRVMEMYLVAEQLHGHRPDILMHFPEPDPKMVEFYTPKPVAESDVPEPAKPRAKRAVKAQDGE